MERKVWIEFGATGVNVTITKYRKMILNGIVMKLAEKIAIERS